MKVHNLLVTGSHTSSGEDIRLISSSVAATNLSQDNRIASLEGAAISGTTITRLNSLETTTGSLNTYTSSVTTRLNSIETTTSSLNGFTSSTSPRLNSIEGKTGSFATTGSNIFVGNQTISGSIIPSLDNTYDLGSVTHQFRDLYLSSASLYIDGTKVLSSTTQELQITTDAGQSFKILEAGSDTITLQSGDGNITLATSGGGDVILDPTTGVIALKGTTTLYAGNKILSSDGNAIQFGNSVTMTGSLIVTGFIETQELRTTYISSSILYRSGSTKFGDELGDTHSFTGSLTVSGSISVPGSGLVSGSSQITYSGLSGVPSGIVSGSSQLPSGLVSGSSQISFGSVSGVPSGLVSGSSQVLSGTGIWSGSAQLPSGVVSGSSQVLAGTTIHSGSFFNGITVVSGSAQVDVMSTTNIARLATTGSNSFTGTQTFGYGRLVASGHNSSAQLTINASYDGGQTNTYTPDYAGDSSGGMFVMKQSNGGAGDVYFYGKNHQTTGGSQALSTFNVIMGMNTNGRVAIGKLTANAPLDVNGNTIVSGTFTTTNAGITNSNTYLGTGQLRVGGGSDHESNTVLSIAPGVVTVDAPGVAGGRLKLDNVGNLGLGTNPTEKLDVYGSVRFRTAIQSDSYYATFAQNAYYTGAWLKYSSGYARTIQLGDGISFKISNVGAGNTGDAITFITPLTITDAGNVGIGNFGANSPTSLLELRNSDATLYDQTVDNGQDSNGVSLTIRNNDISTVGSFSQINMQVSGDSGRALGRIVTIRMGSATSDMAFVTEDANVKSEKLRIASTGALTSTGPGLVINRPASSSGEPYIFFNKDGVNRASIYGGDGTAGLRFFSSVSTFSGNIMPSADATHNLGSTSLRWNNLYTTDLHLSNEGKQNVVDGTWGDWTLQEGENDIYMLNNRSGEKFKIKLEKIIE
jgi:hypothetical protein